MGMPRVPGPLKLLRGNPGKRPLSVEPQPSRTVLPKPPEYLSADAEAEWHRIAPELYHLGLLTLVDVNPFAAYCQAYARWVTAERGIAKAAEDDPVNGGLVIRSSEGNLYQNPLVGIANKAAADMVRYSTEFG